MSLPTGKYGRFLTPVNHLKGTNSCENIHYVSMVRTNHCAWCLLPINLSEYNFVGRNSFRPARATLPD